MSRGRHRHPLPLPLEAMQAGEVVVEEPAERFGVSASTIRRDLQHLANEKTIRRTYFEIVGGDGSPVPLSRPRDDIEGSKSAGQHNHALRPQRHPEPKIPTQIRI